jgi:hypothetical protein
VRFSLRFLTDRMRRAGFLATLAAGLGLLGASLHGMTDVDTTLKVAAAPPPPPASVVLEHRDCERPPSPRL